MAVDTKTKREAALLDQPLLFPDDSIDEPDRSYLIDQYFLSFFTDLLPPAIRSYLYVAFGSVPSDTTYNWRDLTGYLRDDVGTAAAVRRGRQDVTQKPNAGKGTYILDNRALTFEALNAAGPFAGQLIPMVPVQSGIECPWLPGLLADGAFNSGITGWTSTHSILTYAKGLFGELSGRLIVTLTGTGFMTVQAPVTLVTAAMLAEYVMASVRVSNNAAASRTYTLSVNFFTNANGTGANGSATGSATVVAAGTQDARVSVVGGTVIPAGTQSMQLVLTMAVGGAINDVFFVRCAVIDTASDSAIAGVFPDFTGYADGWDCVWDLDNVCTLSCSDALKPLGLAPLNTPLYGAYLATLGATKWYRLGETVIDQIDVLGLSFKDQITGLYDAQVASGHQSDGTPYYLNRGPLAGVAGSSPVDNDFAFSLIGPSSQDGGAIALAQSFQPTQANWSIGFWVRSTNGVPPALGSRTGSALAQQIIFVRQSDPLGAHLAEVLIGIGSNGCVQAYASDRAPTTHSSGTNIDSAISSAGAQNVVVDTLWHRVWVTYLGGTNVLKVYVDGILDHQETQNSGATGFTFGAVVNGTACRIGQLYFAGALTLNSGYPLPFEVDEVMMIDGTALAAGTITTDYITAKVTYPIQTSSARFGAVLDTLGWAAGRRTVDTNQPVEITALAKALFKANAVTYFGTLADSEDGMYFADVSGNMVWVTHASLVDAAQPYQLPVFTFGNASGEVPYEKLVTSNNDSLLYTEGQCQTETGSVQIADATDAVQFFPRAVTRSGLLLDANSKALDMASWLAALFSTTGTKLKQIIINPAASERSLKAAQQIELGDAVAVHIRPPGIPAGSYFTVIAQVTAISVNSNRKKKRLIYDVSDVYTQHWMQFGDNYSSYRMAL